MKSVALICFFLGLVWPCDTRGAQTSSQNESGPFPYAMTVETLRQRRALNSPIFLVDVRSPEAFERTSIQNSLNIPLFAVKSKDFVKTQPLVLLDEGFRPAYLNSSCAQLRDAGFDAWFLLGGLNAWHVSGGELRGDVFAQRELNKVSAWQVFSESLDHGWLMIDASETVNDDNAKLFPQTIHLPFNPMLPDRLFLEVQQAIAVYTAKYAQEPFILLYTQSGKDYEHIERALDGGQLPPVFFLIGGIQGYLAFWTQQKAISGGPQEISTECAPCAR